MKNRPRITGAKRAAYFGSGQSVLKFLIVATFVFFPVVGTAQDLSFPSGTAGDAATVEKALPALAEQVIAGYKENNRVTYLDNLFRLQIVAGRYADALQSLATLHELNLNPQSPATAAYNVQDEIFVRAKLIEGAEKLPFNEAFQRAFREKFRVLDDRVSALVIRTFNVPEQAVRADFDNSVAKQKGKSTITLADALALVRADQIDEEFRAFGPLVSPLIAEEDGRRYLFEKNMQIKTPDSATICAHIMRPRSTTARLPTLMEFTIYNDANPATIARDMRRGASNGYASVVGFTRGKACSPDQSVPYEHDGADAASLIDWITKQSWSDGRVGMYGGSYSGFTPWATAKFRP